MVLCILVCECIPLWTRVEIVCRVDIEAGGASLCPYVLWMCRKLAADGQDASSARSLLSPHKTQSICCLPYLSCQIVATIVYV